MKTTVITILSLVVLLTVSCKNSKPTASNSEETEKPVAMDTLKKVEVIKGYTLPETSDPFKLKDLRIVGDVLEVDVQYSGGCNDHDFSVKTDGNYMKSNPPQLRLIIEHENNGDMCKALITETRKFDLKTVRMTGKDKDYSVILRFNTTDNKLEYKY